MTIDEIIKREKQSADRCKKIFEEFEKNRQNSYDCGYDVGYNKAIDEAIEIVKGNYRMEALEKLEQLKAGGENE